MNGWELLDAVGGIDPVYLAEAEQTAARTRPAQKRRITVALAACVAAAVACAVLLTLRNLPTATPEPTLGEEGSVVIETPSVSVAAPKTETPALPSVPESAAEQTSAAPVAEGASDGSLPPLSTAATQPAVTPETNTEPEGKSGAPEATPEIAVPPDGSGQLSGQLPGEETFGGPPTPTQWSADPPVIRGAGCTEEEIAALLRRDGYAVKQTVSSETGFAPDDVTICAEGWRHTVLGEQNIVDLDYLTLPVCAGDRVVASVDLFRADGELHYSVSAGGPRWDNLNRALAYGDVAFVYAGVGELAVAADGTVFEITVGASEIVAGQSGLYRRAAVPQTVFSLSRLQNAERF